MLLKGYGGPGGVREPRGSAWPWLVGPCSGPTSVSPFIKSGALDQSQAHLLAYRLYPHNLPPSLHVLFDLHNVFKNCESTLKSQEVSH